MVGLEQSLNELLMKLKADDHIWFASQTNREQCNLKRVTELPRTDPVRQCLHLTAVYGLPVFGSESSSSLRALSAVMQFNVVPYTPLPLQVSPRSGIAYCTGFPHLALCKLCCFLLWSFQELISEKHHLISPAYLWSPPAISSPATAPSDSSFQSCYCPAAIALSHRHFICLPESKLVGHRTPLCVTVSFQGWHVSQAACIFMSWSVHSTVSSGIKLYLLSPLVPYTILDYSKVICI